MRRPNARGRSRRWLRAWWPSLVAIVTVSVVTNAVVLTNSNPPATAAAVPCGPGDANRAQLTTVHGKIAMNPCLANTTLRINIGGARPGLKQRYSVTEIRVPGQEDVKMADGTTQKLWHVSFTAFKIIKDATMTTVDAKGGTMSIVPDADASIGGRNDAGQKMYTDVWASAGTFNISLLLCTPLDISNPLVKLVEAANSTLPNSIPLYGCGLNLDAKYMVSYSDNPTQKGNYPLQLPNTAISVK